MQAIISQQLWYCARSGKRLFLGAWYLSRKAVRISELELVSRASLVMGCCCHSFAKPMCLE